jgi:hypothetical protein
MIPLFSHRISIDDITGEDKTVVLRDWREMAEAA